MSSNMFAINKLQLKILNHILATRLFKPTSIDTAIIDTTEEGYTCEKFDRSTHRYVGLFDTSIEGLICFHLGVRKYPDDPIKYIYTFHLETERDPQTYVSKQLQTLMKLFPSWNHSQINVQWGTVIVKSQLNPYVHLSNLAEAIDFMIGNNLLLEFHKYQVVTVESKMQPTLPARGVERFCDGDFTMEEIINFKTMAESFNINFDLYKFGVALENPEFVIIESRGHWIGCYHNKHTRIVIFMIVHFWHVENQSQLDNLKALAYEFYGEDIKEIIFTRFYPNTHIKCTYHDVVWAWSCTFQYQPHIFHTLRANDLNLMYKVRENCRINLSAPIQSRSMYQRQILRLDSPSLRASQDDSMQNTQITFDLAAADQYPKILAQSAGSAITLGRREIEGALIFWRQVSDRRRKAKGSAIPPVHQLGEYHDVTSRYLIDMPTYEEAILMLANMWNKIVPTVASKIVNNPLTHECYDITAAKYVIYPWETLKTSAIDSIIVVDIEKREWIFLTTDNDDLRDPVVFKELTEGQIRRHLPVLENKQGRIVNITSSYHEEYPRIHLLMALYTIYRTFEVYNCRQLPLRIIYGEWEFRRYASNICAELQLVNSEYNMRNNLLNEDGSHVAGAKISYPSPVKAIPAVVNSNDCMFCRKRGFKNLGKHIAAAHGGQAQLANAARLEYD